VAARAPVWNRGGVRARLIVQPIPSRAAPEEAALRVAEDSFPFALIGAWAGGGALIGSEPIAIADGDPFEALASTPIQTPTEGDGVGGGWFGYLGYGLGARLEKLPPSPPRPTPLPEFHLAFYDHLLRLHDGEWRFEALWTPERDEALRARYELLCARMDATPSELAGFSFEPFRVIPERAAHEDAVARCLEHIAEGEIFQANVCARLEARFQGSAAAMFASAVTSLQPPYAAFLSGPWGAVASMSPELFLRREGRHVRTAPIKGTSARDTDPARARAQRDDLIASAKNRAENVMIVDLMRNDLGRVCRPGSVRVPDLARAEEHPGVWHLVSDVVGELRSEVTDADLLRACFPPGSVTGAPKIRAMELITALEATAREVYTGAIGYVSPIAGLEMNVAIRTFEFSGERAWLGVGGGIVADSDPASEFEECLTKATPLLRAAGAVLETKPDPALGIFETLLVVDGVALELDEHLTRLAGSLRALYGMDVPPEVRARVIDRATQTLGRARLRLDVLPRGEFEIATGPAPDPGSARLFLLPVRGGLGEHKWRDRTLLKPLPDGSEPLIADGGELLEAARANLFIVEDDRVVTPPADGRILPGITRAAVMRLAADEGIPVREEAVSSARAARASEVFVTGSLRGIEPVTSCSPIGTWPEGPVTRSLARALWRARGVAP